MNESVTVLKGVGPKTAEALSRLNIYTVQDLIRNYPRTYETFSKPTSICELHNSGQGVIRAVICSKPFKTTKGGRTVVSVWLDDGTGKIRAFWFNNPWIINSLKYGKSIVLRGRVSCGSKGKFLSQPKIYDAKEYDAISGSLLPIYNLTSGISNNQMLKMTARAFEVSESDQEYLPKEILDQFNLKNLGVSEKNIHFPNDKEELVSARKRLVFDEFFMFILAVKSLKNISKNENGSRALSNFQSDYALFLEGALPYSLTSAQKRAWSEISCDMSSERPMNRLLQGDVGSGKTVVAALAMARAVSCGYQAALIAPTLILAEQHYNTLRKMFSDANININIVLLTGALKSTEKKDVYKKIKEGAADIIIGTHAVIQDEVIFNNLALVITDEQHRFGVNQRMALTRKNHEFTPHTLVMSATPIPRTLAIILYGEQSVSVLDEKPSGRLPIKNCVVGTAYRERSLKFIKEQVTLGHQCYVICPLIEDNDISDTASAVTEASKLSKFFGKSLSVGLLHGRMKSSEKEKVMRDFSAGDIDVLVSTTVIEVGVDVPNATVMLVENAECFGLSQLHQLRGRIGRGSSQSYCIFMDGSEKAGSNERLKVLENTNDGFKIASEDLRLRGPGDLFGVRQSGDFCFELGDIYMDAEILISAASLAENVLNSDPTLSGKTYSALSDRLSNYMRIRNNVDNLLL